jgi:uncharacterized membrane protein YvbJ
MEQGKARNMAFCPKCGSKIEEEMSFCPKCGASLKEGQVAQPRTATHRRDEKAEKHEKDEKGEKVEKHEKREYSFIAPLIGGLILIFLGMTSYLEITNFARREMLWAFFFVMVGVVVIVAAIFGAMMAGRRHPKP